MSSKKWLCLSIVFFSLGTGLFAEKDSGLQDAFSSYNPVYFIVGTGDFVSTQLLDENNELGERIDTQQNVKLGFSMKYQFFHEYKTGLYLGFTQTMFWDIFNESSPFSELNYNPDFFFRFESENNFAQDLDTGFLEYFQLGLEHKSNGLAGTESRALDRVYGQLELGAGDRFRLSVNAKYMIYLQDFLPQWYQPEILDFEMHRSNWRFRAEADMDFGWAFFLPHYIVLEAAPGGGKNQFDFTQGYQQLDIIFGNVFGGLHPFIQVWNGYGEGLIAYDESNLSIRAGIMLR